MEASEKKNCIYCVVNCSIFDSSVSLLCGKCRLISGVCFYQSKLCAMCVSISMLCLGHFIFSEFYPKMWFVVAVRHSQQKIFAHSFASLLRKLIELFCVALFSFWSTENVNFLIAMRLRIYSLAYAYLCVFCSSLFESKWRSFEKYWNIFHHIFNLWLHLILCFARPKRKLFCGDTQFLSFSLNVFVSARCLSLLWQLKRRQQMCVGPSTARGTTNDERTVFANIDNFVKYFISIFGSFLFALRFFDKRQTNVKCEIMPKLKWNCKNKRERTSNFARDEKYFAIYALKIHVISMDARVYARKVKNFASLISYLTTGHLPEEHT